MSEKVEAPTLPDLPAMSSPAVRQGSTSVYNPQPYEQSGLSAGTRHLKRAASLLVGGGFVLVIVLLLGEKMLMPEWRPTTLLAGFESTLELKSMIGKMPVGKDGKEIRTQGDYEQAIAAARAEGGASVQFEYQKKLAAVQADQQRVVEAYSSLYQRANAIAQAGLQMEAALQQAKQQMVASSQGGRQQVTMWGDIGCALGMQGGCDAAQQARSDMVTDMDMARTDVGSRIKELMGDVPDPATFVARTDRATNGTPTLSQ